MVIAGREMKHAHHDDIHKPCPRGHTEGVIRIAGGGKSFYYCDLCYQEDQIKKTGEHHEDSKPTVDEASKSLRDKKRPDIPPSKEPKA